MDGREVRVAVAVCVEDGLFEGTRTMSRSRCSC